MRASRPRSRQGCFQAAPRIELAGWERGRLARISSAPIFSRTRWRSTLPRRCASVWAALRDVGALHTRLVPGFVVDTKLEDGARIVTFANGMVARELIVDIDDAAHRLVWSVVGTAMTHHNGVAQVFAEGPERCRFVWVADLLPHEAAPGIAAMMEQGIAVVQQTLERAERHQEA